MGSWLRWETAAVVAAALIIGYLLLVKPVVGMADNGDFLRIMGTVGLTDAHPEESFDDKYFGYFHLKYAFGPWRPGGYISTQLLPTLAAEGIGLLLPGPLFDIRVLGVLYAAVFGWALILTVRHNRMRRWWANALMVALLLFVFADVGYIAYFNSLFGEPTTYVFLLFAIAAAFQLARREEPSRRWAVLLLAAAIMTVGSKTQTAPAGVAFMLIVWRLWRMRQDKPWRGTVRRWSIGLAAVTLVIFFISPPSFDRINHYQAVFYGILKDSPTPEQDLRELGLDPNLAVNAGTDYFTPAAAIPQQDPRLDSFYRNVGVGKVIGFYLTHPGRFWQKLEAAADSGWTIRPYYLGNYEKNEGKPRGAISYAFGAWSQWKMKYHPNGFGWIVLLYAVYGLGLWREYRRARTDAERLVPDMFTAVAAIGAISLVIPFIGSGEADFAKHLFLFTVCLDIMLVSGVVWVLRRLAGQ